jgi:predicted nucleotide-binding protein
MPKRPSSNPPTRAFLTAHEKLKAVRRFQALMERFESFEPQTIADMYDPKIDELAVAARSALERTYPPGTTQYDQLSRLADIQYAVPVYAGRPTPEHEVRDALAKMKASRTVLVRQAIRDLKEDLDDQDDPIPSQGTRLGDGVTRAAFIVHGHDEGPREAVARFMEKLGITPIILHEQPSKGRTIIEKFEQHGDVPFAIVLLTPDDVGGALPDSLKPRGRQNVILELGYFIGKLGRDRVCAIKKGDVEQPSDVVGIAYVDYDDQGAWRQKLATELHAAKIHVDWNKVMKA